MYLSTVAANAALKALVGDDHSGDLPATLYLGLSETQPTLTAGALTGITEPAAGGYTRVAVSNSNGQWSVADGVAENSSQISFPEATSDYAAPVSYLVVFDAASGGEALWYGLLSNAPIAIASSVQLVFDAGTITISHA